MSSTYTAFIGAKLLASGDLLAAALAAHAAQNQQNEMPMVFEDATGKVVDLDLRGTAQEVKQRLQAAMAALDSSHAHAAEPPRRGRPKLGVTAREITLLPRHWAWLQEQPGGASATIRRLVEQARQGSAEIDARRNSQT